MVNVKIFMFVLCLFYVCFILLILEFKIEGIEKEEKNAKEFN